MPNPYYYMSNPGAILRRMFPQQLNTQARIIMWTIVFIINIVTTILMQNYVVYKVTDVSREGLSQVSCFENCEIREIKKMPYDQMHIDAYRVTYISESGVEEAVYLEEFPVYIFGRYRMKTSDKPTSALFWHSKPLEKLAGVYIACGLVLLGIEFFLYNVFHKLFRE